MVSQEIIVEIKTNCKNCKHRNVCKFRQAASDLFKSNMMYGMFEHLEWNTLLDSFDTNASGCKHYIQDFVDGPIKHGITPKNLIDVGLRQWFKEIETSWVSWSGTTGSAPNIILKGETEPKPFSFFEERISLKRV